MAILPGSDARGNTPEAMGGLMFPPGLDGYNVAVTRDVRRTMQLDDANRIATQLEKDRGVYIRPPVGPVEYAESNIKKSTALTGVAGYNQKNIPIPNSPDDMSQAQYMESIAQSVPEQRMRMRQALSVGKQNFLNTPTMPQEYPLTSHNMMNNLLALAKQKLGK